MNELLGLVLLVGFFWLAFDYGYQRGRTNGYRDGLKDAGWNHPSLYDDVHDQDVDK